MNTNTDVVAVLIIPPAFQVSSSLIPRMQIIAQLPHLATKASFRN